MLIQPMQAIQNLISIRLFIVDSSSQHTSEISSFLVNRMPVRYPSTSIARGDRSTSQGKKHQALANHGDLSIHVYEGLARCLFEDDLDSEDCETAILKVLGQGTRSQRSSEGRPFPPSKFDSVDASNVSMVCRDFAQSG